MRPPKKNPPSRKVIPTFTVFCRCGEYLHVTGLTAARGQAKNHTTETQHLSRVLWQKTATVEQMEGTWAPTE